MIVTANKYVNARIGRPFTDAPNPSYLQPGDQVEVVKRVIGDFVNGNNKWISTTDNTFYSEAGFHAVNELTSLSLYSYIDNASVIFDELGIDQIWQFTKGEKITVIVLDSGFSECPDISKKVFKMSCFNDNGDDEIGHGSLMCSIIAGNGSEIIGIAPNCSLVSIKFKKANDEDNLSWENFFEGLKKIKEVINENEIFIVNCSCAGLLTDTIKIKNFQDIVDFYTTNYKIIFLCAVGNDSDYKHDIQIMPARLKNVISVAGLDKNGNRLLSSNYWEGINLTCLGETASDFFKRKYPKYENTGSSHACAFASSILALFLSKIAKNSFEFDLEKIAKIIIDSSLSTNKTNDYNLFDHILNKQKLLQTFKSIL